MPDQLADLYLLLQQAEGVPDPKSSGNDLSWMWSEPGASTILEWLVNNVNSKCLLTHQELKEYRRLESSGRIPDSSIVKDSNPMYKGSDVSEGVFSKDRICRDIETLSRHQRVSMEVLSSGRLRHATLSSRLQTCKQNLEQTQRHVTDQQLLLNGAFQELMSALTRTCDRIHNSKNSIIQKQLDGYFETDVAFLNNIKETFDSLRRKRREMDEKIVSLPEKSHQDNVEELERIKSIFVISERQRIDADILLSEVKAEDSFVSSQACAENSIRSLCDDLQSQYDDAYNTKLDTLLKRLAKYQKTDVLRGDYILKIARQQTYLRLQAQILKELIQERARHSLLQCAFMRAHADQDKVLELANAAQKHMDCLEAILENAVSMVNSESSLEVRKAIDDSDRSGVAVEQALCCAVGEKPSSLLVTYNRIEQMANTIMNNVVLLESNLARTSYDHSGSLSKLVNDLHQLYSLLTLSSSTCKPTLSHQPLVNLVSKVQQVMEALKEKIAILQIEESSKQRALSNDKDLVFERDTFINFFQNPAVLDEDARRLCLQTRRHK